MYAAAYVFHGVIGAAAAEVDDHTGWGVLGSGADGGAGVVERVVTLDCADGGERGRAAPSVGVGACGGRSEACLCEAEEA